MERIEYLEWMESERDFGARRDGARVSGKWELDGFPGPSGTEQDFRGDWDWKGSCVTVGRSESFGRNPGSK